MFGKFNELGDIEQDVDICVLTGRKVEPGDIMYRFPGTRYFVRVAAAAKKDWTAEAKEALKTLLPEDAFPQLVVEEMPQASPAVASELPVFPALHVEAEEPASPAPTRSSRRSISSAAQPQEEE